MIKELNLCTIFSSHFRSVHKDSTSTSRIDFPSTILEDQHSATTADLSYMVYSDKACNVKVKKKLYFTIQCLFFICEFSVYENKYFDHVVECLGMCVCVCEFVITVNRGHTLKLHIQTEDNIANEDGPRFVDMCKRLQIAYSCIYRGMLKKREKITCHRVWSSVQRLKSHTQVCVSAILHTKCPIVADSTSNTHILV